MMHQAMRREEDVARCAQDFGGGGGGVFCAKEEEKGSNFLILILCLKARSKLLQMDTDTNV